MLILLACATAVSATWAANADASSLSVSSRSDRSNAATLDGQAYDRSAVIHVFLQPEAGVRSVRFYLDDPTRSGLPRHVENIAPYDFVNTAHDGSAVGFAVGSLSDGVHTVTGEILRADGQVAVASGTFRAGAAVATAASSLSVSSRSDRSNAATLDGQAYDRSAVIHVFLQPQAGVRSVRFYLDDPTRSGLPRHVENIAPYDFVNTAHDGSAVGFAVGSLSDGVHTVTGEILKADGQVAVASGTFGVRSAILFEDDFDGDTLDTARWGAYDGSGHAGNGLRRPSAFSVRDGNLVVTAKMVDGQIVSGGMAHLEDYTYGRYEFRVRTEVDQTGTMSGVVLTWPQHQWSPEFTENDIYETGPQLGHRWQFRSFVHYGLGNWQKEFVHDADSSQWHTMAMDWRPSSLKIYRDGELVWTITDPSVIPDVLHHLTIQLDAFGERTLTTPVRMFVDYVRISR